MNKLFNYWILLVSIMVIIAGIVFAIIAPYFNITLQDIFYHSFNEQTIQQLSSIDKNHINWIYGVLGGTLAGWGIMILFLSINLLKNNQKDIWNIILYSVITWFLIDTTITLKYAVIPNLIINITILLLVLIPYIGNNYITKKT